MQQRKEGGHQRNLKTKAKGITRIFATETLLQCNRRIGAMWATSQNLSPRSCTSPRSEVLGNPETPISLKLRNIPYIISGILLTIIQGISLNQGVLESLGKEKTTPAPCPQCPWSAQNPKPKTLNPEPKTQNPKP